MATTGERVATLEAQTAQTMEACRANKRRVDTAIDRVSVVETQTHLLNGRVSGIEQQTGELRDEYHEQEKAMSSFSQTCQELRHSVDQLRERVMERVPPVPAPTPPAQQIKDAWSDTKTSTKVKIVAAVGVALTGILPKLLESLGAVLLKLFERIG